MRWKERIAVALGWIAILFALILVVLLVTCEASAENNTRGAYYSAPLEDRVIAWLMAEPARNGRWLLRRRGEEERVRQIARLADVATSDTRIPPELVLALSYRESRWQEGVVGARGEIGLMQIHGVALGKWRHRPRVVWHPALNLRLGVLHLQRAVDDCLGDLGWGLGKYATGECRPPRNDEDTQVIAWAYEMLTQEVGE